MNSNKRTGAPTHGCPPTPGPQQAETDLHRSERRYRSLVDAVSELVWTTDPYGEEQEFIGGEKFFGLGEDRFTRADWAEKVHPDDRERLLRAWAEALAEQKLYSLEYRERRADGEWRNIAAHAVPVRGPDGRIEEWVGASHDVTTKRRREEKVQQVQKMDALGQLAGGVAHHFNNLLTAIIGNAELLLSDLRSGDPAAGLAEAILGAGERAASVAKSLLTFSRRSLAAPRVIDLGRTVGERREALGGLVGEGIELITTLAPGPIPVQVDPDQLDHVLSNLAANARDAMRGGGRLTIEVRRVPREDASDAGPGVGECAVLVVADTGCGMAPETLARVFEPFFSTKEPGQGMGLGLAAVYGIVRQSGGTVTVSSQAGRGTTVRIDWPLTKDGSGPAGAPAASALGGKTILLVDDEPAVRGFCRTVLERSGDVGLEAGDGQEALQQAERHPGRIDMLVTDVTMPRLGGRELAKRLTRTAPGLRVLFMSGYAEDLFREGVLRAEGAFLRKPFSPQVLVQHVGDALRRDCGD